MQEYHKIQSIYKRDIKGKFMIGEWATPEIAYLKDLEWDWDEKINGTNTRIHWEGHKVRFGGRTDNSQIPMTLLHVLQDMFPEDLFEKHFGSNSATLYGEGFGAKIQKGGGNYSQSQSFCLFDVHIDEFWLKRENVEDIAHKMSLQIAPRVGVGCIEHAIEFAKTGFNSKWGDFKAEGLVLRPKTQLFDRQGKRVIIKVKYKDFLI